MWGKKPRYRCELCGDRVGFLDEFNHRMTVHPEVVAVQRALAREYLTRYFPIAMTALVLGSGPMILHDWWWRYGFLAGIYSMFAIMGVFGVRAWKREGPVRRRVTVSCGVCASRKVAADIRGHMFLHHPEVARAMARSAWLLTPTLLALLVYVLVMLWTADLGPVAAVGLGLISVPDPRPLLRMDDHRRRRRIRPRAPVPKGGLIPNRIDGSMELI